MSIYLSCFVLERLLAKAFRMFFYQFVSNPSSPIFTAMLSLTPSYGSKVCVYIVKRYISAFRNMYRLVETFTPRKQVPLNTEGNHPKSTMDVMFYFFSKG